MCELRVCSYNCFSLNKNIDLVRELTSTNYDIIFLQETLVTNNNINILDYVDESYKSIGIGAIFSEKAIEAASGRPMGGLACIFKSNIPVKLVGSTNDIMIISITINNTKLILVNAYLRSVLGDPITIAEYTNTLHQLDQMLSEIEYDSIFLLGDWNADPMSGQAWRLLFDFMVRNKYVCFDRDYLPPETFTFIGNGSGYVKWLDHIIGNNTGNCKLISVEVLDNMVGSDHLPIACSMKVPILDLI